jgi:CO/xanthine dehydrogenase Mo-binding subunit
MRALGKNQVSVSALGFGGHHLGDAQDEQTAASTGSAVYFAARDLRQQPEKSETLQALIARSGQQYIQGFAEVRIDAGLGQIRVSRMVGAFDAGRILNAKTARSQFMGGMVWGVSFALYEHSVYDERLGRIVNNNLAEYHVPTNADIGSIETLWVDDVDEHVSPIGAKGIGEIGIMGVAAAIANAVFHATGKRVRDLPITLDKLL